MRAGYLLRMLQSGTALALPHSRPMPVVGARCHELRIQDENRTWRIVYRVDADAIVIVEVLQRLHRQPRRPRSKTASDDCVRTTTTLRRDSFRWNKPSENV